jgi:uroporphyrinogen-III synthase
MKLNARPLRGLTIAITSSRRAPELAHLITSFGGTPYIAPTVGIESKHDHRLHEVTRFINTLVSGELDYAVFMTGPGVYTSMSTAESLGQLEILLRNLEDVKIVARSPKPQKVLKDYGIIAHALPNENTAEGIADMFRSWSIAGKGVAILWHGSRSSFLVDELRKFGARVYEFSTYSYSFESDQNGARILNSLGFHYESPIKGKVIKLIEEIGNRLIHVITFTSPPSVTNLFSIADSNSLKGYLQLSLNSRVIVVAVGPSTKRAIEENGVNVDVMPKTYKMGAMISALNDYVRNGGSKLQKNSAILKEQ